MTWIHQPFASCSTNQTKKMTSINVGLLVAAWFTGLAGGSGHCLGMCGGIIGALGVGQKKGSRGIAVLVSAHVGRVAGYAVAGALGGLIGAQLSVGLLGPNALVTLRVASGVLIAIIGLQLLLGKHLLSRLERGGALVWRHIAPTFRSLLPPRTPVHGFAVGVLWGWLPCGLVYAQLAVATTSGSAIQGALSMSAFGLGTMLSLSAMSILLHSLGLARLPRQASGALLLVFAVWTVFPILSAGHAMH